MLNFLRNIFDSNRRKLDKKGLLASRKRRTQADSITSSFERSKSLGYFMLSAVWLFIALILISPLRRAGKLDLVKGQLAPQVIFSQLRFFYEDKAKTKKARVLAKKKVPLYFDISKEKNAASEGRALVLGRIMENAADLQQASSGLEKLNIVLPHDPEAFKLFKDLLVSPRQKKAFFDELGSLLKQGMISQERKKAFRIGQKIRIIDSQGRERFPKLVEKITTPEISAGVLADSLLKYYSPKDRNIIHNIFRNACTVIIGSEGNLVFNEARTLKEQKIAAAEVKPVMVEVKKHQPLINRGQIVSDKLLEKLQVYKEKLEQSSRGVVMWQKVIFALFWSIVLIAITGIYISHIHPEVVRSNHKIWLTGVVTVAAVGTNYLFTSLFFFLSENFNIMPELVRIAPLLGLASLLLSVLIGLRVAVYIGFMVSLITAIMLGNRFDIVLQGLAISCFAGIVVRYSRNYRSYFINGFAVCFIFSMLFNMNFLWMMRDNLHTFIWAVSLCFANALLTAIIALVLIFVVEPLFNVATDMSLFMFFDYNHPLLRRLQLEAPGTFHHSLMVSTLAEYAAAEIGANPIKARIGAIFHDIGKLTKPEYYTENNVNAEEKHNELHPRMSSLLILNHVKDGVDLAMKYKLKKIIRDAIEQHHGTDIVFYFYRRALEERDEKTGVAREHEYRYPGPLPHEKEVVIISLADAAEAAARSLIKPTPNKVEALVNEIFRRRIREGQLDQADMTLAELARVKESFIKTLTTMHHGRVAYPKEEANDDSDLFSQNRKNGAAAQENADSADPQRGEAVQSGNGQKTDTSSDIRRKSPDVKDES